MRWLSIDPAEKTGLVIWEGATPLVFATLRPGGKREIAALKLGSDVLIFEPSFVASSAPEQQSAFASAADAWLYLLSGLGAVVVEESFGDAPKTVAQMGERRGYIRCACERDSRPVPFRTIHTSEWRRVCGERLGQSWPAASKAAKQRSVDLVREHCNGLVVTNDEGDAYWIGRAAMWLGLVTP